MERVQVKYKLYDDINDKTYYREEIGYRIDENYVVTYYGDDMMGIDHIFCEKDGYVIIDEEDSVSPIFVNLDNIGQIDLFHESALNFYKYLVEQHKKN
ncbi:hypothetical protein [Virgibacillus sediminis]|uniref:Uncharacterized protein n=1 Tax=Virgibacillus sediminis TaxID=202260 RepID=A0ABV7A8S5_9BACI